MSIIRLRDGKVFSLWTARFWYVLYSEAIAHREYEAQALCACLCMGCDGISGSLRESTRESVARCGSAEKSGIVTPGFLTMALPSWENDDSGYL